MRLFGDLFAFTWWRVLLGHGIATTACGLALLTQTWFRVPSQGWFLLIPYVNAAVLVLSILVTVNHVLRGQREDDPLRSLVSTAERVSSFCVRLFVVWSLFLFANAALDRSEAVVKEADVVVVAGADINFGFIPHSWVALRPVDDPDGVQRILKAIDDPPLWAGRPVLVEERRGFFGVPWIALLTVDDVRASIASLKVSPTSAEAWKHLIKGYAMRAQVPELVNATVEYTRLHPLDHEFPERIALGLGMGGQCAGMHAILSRFVGRRTDYEFYTYMGYALACLKRRDEAMKFLDKAIALEPKNWWAYYHAGYLFFDGQKFEQARPYFAKVLAIRHIPDVARDVATVDKILALKRAREHASRN